MDINYIGRSHRIDEEPSFYRYEYLFKIEGDQSAIISVCIAGKVPLLGPNVTENELRVAAQRFLERECQKGWRPTAENPRLAISNREIEMFRRS